MMLTWRKEWRINVNAEVCKEGRVNQCRSLKGGEMLDRDEHAEAMRILTSDLRTVFTTDISNWL